MRLLSSHRAASLRSLSARLFFLFLINCLLTLNNAAFAATPSPEPVRYNLDVSFDPATSSLSGTALIRLKTAQSVVLDVESLRVKTVLLDGRPWQGKLTEAKQLNLPSARRIEITWSACISGSQDHGIFPESIVLTDVWFPIIKGMVRYKLRASLPKGYLAVSAGETVSLRHSGGRAVMTFDFPHPMPGDEGLCFAASNRYQLREEQLGGVILRTLLTGEMSEYAVPLMEQAKKLLTHYQKLFGPYPFKRLTLAEASTSCSLSYPGYILLNRGNIKGLPEDRTLAHEIVHEWFGNGVFISWETGNWAEGAAIYFADHGFQEGADNGWVWRRRMLHGYLDWAADKQEFPLSHFQSREDALSLWVGYGKGGLFFHAARMELGDDLFLAAIRDFLGLYQGRVAAFDDLQRSFEKASGKDLSWFFRQWVAGTGLPELSGHVSVRAQPDNSYTVTLQLAQKGGQSAFRLNVPVRITSASGEETVMVVMDDSEVAVTLESAGRPSRVVIDPEFNLPRILSINERIPTIGQLDSDYLQVLGRSDQQERFLPLLENFKLRGVIVRTLSPHRDTSAYRAGLEKRFRPAQGSHQGKRTSGAGMVDSELAGRSLVIMGRDHPVVNQLFGDMPPVLPELPEKGMSVAVLKSPLNPKRTVAIFDSSDRDETRSGIERLENYGGYSSVVFSGDALVSKSIADGARGIVLPMVFEENEP